MNKKIILSVLPVAFFLFLFVAPQVVQASSQVVQKTSEENNGGWQINTPNYYVKSVVGQWIVPRYNASSYGRLNIFVGLGRPIYQEEQIISPQIGVYMSSSNNVF